MCVRFGKKNCAVFCRAAARRKNTLARNGKVTTFLADFYIFKDFI